MLKILKNQGKVYDKAIPELLKEITMVDYD
jgi:hypothetical protein